MKPTTDAFSRFFGIVRSLRDPDGGCPWDLEQTPQSLRSDLLEEAYETVDAVNSGADDHLREELGDVYLLATMMAYICEQEGRFTVSEVLDEVGQKLVRRHPHVFGDSEVADSKGVVEQWDSIKRDVEGRGSTESVLDDILSSLPPLERAYRMQKKAAKNGFDWPERSDVFVKVHEEARELQAALQKNSPASAVEDEVGDMIFSIVNVARRFGVDPALALHRTNSKFKRRFGYVEREMQKRGKQMSQEDLALMDELWEEAKELEKNPE